MSDCLSEETTNWETQREPALCLGVTEDAPIALYLIPVLSFSNLTLFSLVSLYYVNLKKIYNSYISRHCV